MRRTDKKADPLGQGKPASWKRRALEGLWETGQLAALAAVMDAWGLPLRPAPAGARLLPAMGDAQVAGAVALLRGVYWNEGVGDARIAGAQRASPAWVGAVDADDPARVLASARASTDGHKLAHVMDVVVDLAWRGRGLGRAVMDLLLEHPSLRGCQRVDLHTKDAGPFYARLGFARQRPPAWRQSWRLQR